MSVTWYTWLEQGRGGPPSVEVLERLALALELDRTARELLFLIAQHRPPPLMPGSTPQVSPTLQRVLDAFGTAPAFVKTPTWDIVAWNAAATVVLTDFAALPAEGRNVLRRLFLEPEVRGSLLDWEEHARFAIATFRIDVARTGDRPEAAALAAELLASSPESGRIWAENEVRSYGSGRKRLNHPAAAPLTVDYSTLAVDGADGLSIVVFIPATAADAQAIQRLLP